MVDLYLHVGAWKTGTTTLQRRVFPSYDAYVGGHSSSSNSLLYAQLHRCLFSHKKLRDPTGKSWQHDVEIFLSKARATKLSRILASDESLWGHLPDVVADPSRRDAVETLAQQLHGIRERMHPDEHLRVALTIRSQWTILPSMYAEAASRGFEPSQDGLDAFVARQLSSHSPGPLHWYENIRHLEGAIGAENLSVHVFEDGMKRVAEGILRALDPTAGLTDIPPRSNSGGGSSGDTWMMKRRHWARAAMEFPSSVWPVDVLPRTRLAVRRALGAEQAILIGHRLAKRSDRRYRDEITVTDSRQRAIRSYFAESNNGLAEHLKRDLTSLGY